MSQIVRLQEIVAQLRAPNGCPWDREQTHKSILKDLIEESYELFDAVEEGDDTHIREELGDILLQVVFHSQIATEENRFTLEEVAKGIADKLVHRHPHVFGDLQVSSSDEVVANWERIKRGEEGNAHRVSVLDGIPRHLPALAQAEKVQKRAARVGFDWPTIAPVLDKVEEEFAEFREALEAGEIDNAEKELGDILFALTNVARHSGFSAEEALHRTIAKFTARFHYIENIYDNDAERLSAAGLTELDSHWEASKKSFP